MSIEEIQGQTCALIQWYSPLLRSYSVTVQVRVAVVDRTMQYVFLESVKSHTIRSIQKGWFS